MLHGRTAEKHSNQEIVTHKLVGLKIVTKLFRLYKSEEHNNLYTYDSRRKEKYNIQGCRTKESLV